MRQTEATTGFTGKEVRKGGRLPHLIGAVLAASLALAPMDSTIARERRSERAAPAAVVRQLQAEKPASVAAEEMNSKGTDFYLAFPDASYVERGITKSSKILFWVSGDEATEGYVSSSAGLFDPIKYTVTPGEAISIVVPGEVSGATHAHSAPAGVSDRSIRVTSTADVSVYGMSYEEANTDGFMAIPTKSLGREYVVAAYNSSPSVKFASGPQIVATEDNTLITVTWQITTARASTFIDPVLGFLWGSMTNTLTDVVYLSELNATPPVSTMVLNAGEVFAHYVYTDDLSGSIVEASKPVMVTGWRNLTLIPDSYTAADQILESMPPTESWGRNYVAMPTAGRTWGDTFRIFGAQSDTVVYVNGRNLGTIGRGQWIEHRTEKVETKVFTSTRPIMVQQYTNGSRLDGKPGDPSMLTVTPLEQGLSRYTIATPQYLPQTTTVAGLPPDAEFTNTLNIVAPEVVGVQIYVDGERVTNLASSGMGFLTATVAISPSSHVATGTLPFVMSVNGLRRFEAYAYPAGSSYQRLSSVSSLTFSPNTGTFSVANGQKCFEATVEKDDGTAAAGLAVYLYGPNGNIVASAVADADGKASLCYTGTDGDVGVTVVAGLLSVEADIRWSASLSSDANLIGLAIAPGTLTPAFVSDTTSYTASVPDGTTSAVVTATTSDANATVAYASSAGSCIGTPTSCAIAGPKTWITATVTAEDGTAKEYSIEITVAAVGASDDANLLGLAIAPGTLTPAFVSGTTSYTASVPDGTTSAAVTATTSDANATVAYASSAGACTASRESESRVRAGAGSAVCAIAAPKTWITVTVTAANGDVREYVIEVTAASSLTTIGRVWPTLGVPEGGMPVTLFGTGFSVATGVRVSNSITNVLVPFTATGDGRIDFVMPAGVDGTWADITVETGGDATTASQAFWYQAPVRATFDGQTGEVITLTDGTVITVPAQGVSGSFVITLTPLPPQPGLPGSLLLHVFQLEAAQDGAPIAELAKPLTIVLPVGASIVPAGEQPWLFQWTGDGRWALVRGRPYVSGSSEMVVAVRPTGLYALSTSSQRPYYLPLVPVVR